MKYHERSGQIFDVIMSFDKENSRIAITIPKDSLFGGAILEVKVSEINLSSDNYFLINIVIQQSIDVNDIAEIRPGCHSLGFVKTKSTNLHKLVSADIHFDQYEILINSKFK